MYNRYPLIIAKATQLAAACMVSSIVYDQDTGRFAMISISIMHAD